MQKEEKHTCIISASYWPKLWSPNLHHRHSWCGYTQVTNSQIHSRFDVLSEVTGENV